MEDFFLLENYDKELRKKIKIRDEKMNELKNCEAHKCTSTYVHYGDDELLIVPVLVSTLLFFIVFFYVLINGDGFFSAIKVSIVVVIVSTIIGSILTSMINNKIQNDKVQKAMQNYQLRLKNEIKELEQEIRRLENEKKQSQTKFEADAKELSNKFVRDDFIENIIKKVISIACKEIDNKRFRPVDERFEYLVSGIEFTVYDNYIGLRDDNISFAQNRKPLENILEITALAMLLGSEVQLYLSNKYSVRYNISYSYSSLFVGVRIFNKIPNENYNPPKSWY